MSLAVDWIKNLKSDEDKKDFEQTLKNSVYVLTRLRQILQERDEALSRKETSLSIYENTSWAYLQAHINGRREENQYIQKLLSFLDK